MKRLFASIRRSLLEGNQSGKYLKYALGEIVLVMIGILLALQVNNWNEERKEKRQGALLKENLHREFTQNQRLLDTILQLNQKAFEANRALVDLVGSDAAGLARHNLDSLFYYALIAESFLPSKNTVDDALRSGQMDLIRDDTLKNTLLHWGTQLDLIQTYKAIQNDWQNQQLIPLMNRYVSLRQTDRYGSKPWAGPSRVSFSYEPIFQLLEFENIVDNNLYILQFLIERLKEIQATQEEVLTRTGTPEG